MSVDIKTLNKSINIVSALINALTIINRYGDEASLTVDSLLNSLTVKMAKAREHRDFLLEEEINRSNDLRKILLNRYKTTLRKLTEVYIRISPECKDVAQKIATSCTSYKDHHEKFTIYTPDYVRYEQSKSETTESKGCSYSFTIKFDGKERKKLLCLHFKPESCDSTEYAVKLGFADVMLRHLSPSEIHFYGSYYINSFTEFQAMDANCTKHTVTPVSENLFTVNRDDNVEEHLIIVEDCWDDVLEIIKNDKDWWKIVKDYRMQR